MSAIFVCFVLTCPLLLLLEFLCYSKNRRTESASIEAFFPSVKEAKFLFHQDKPKIEKLGSFVLWRAFGIHFLLITGVIWRRKDPYRNSQ